MTEAREIPRKEYIELCKHPKSYSTVAMNAWDDKLFRLYEFRHFGNGFGIGTTGHCLWFENKFPFYYYFN